MRATLPSAKLLFRESEIGGDAGRRFFLGARRAIATTVRAGLLSPTSRAVCQHDAGSGLQTNAGPMSAENNWPCTTAALALLLTISRGSKGGDGYKQTAPVCL